MFPNDITQLLPQFSKMDGMASTVEISREEYEKLRESEALFHQIADSAPVLLWLTDADGLCTWFNKQWVDFRGRTLAQDLGNGWAEGIHPDDLDRVLKIYLEHFEKRFPFRMEFRLKRADGKYRWILGQGVPRFSDSGTFQGFIGSCLDITEIQLAKELQFDISKRLAELAAIVESSDDVILSKSLDGIITSWNAAASRVFGYSPEEMVGASILKLIPEALQSEEKTIIENIRAGRRVDHFETVRATKDGRLLDVSLTVSPIKDDQGKVIGASKILRDISSRKRIEQSLLQAEKIAATGRMAATIAHEINNPLEAVMNLLYLLRPLVTDAEGLSYLTSVESELARVSHIAKQTLGYYKEHATASSATLSDIVQHALSIYEPRCVAAGIQVERDIASSTKLVLRRGETMQVISNLIANSIYAMSNGGVLKVTVRDTTDPTQGVVLSIQDNGVGIEPQNLTKVFDAFFTTRSTVGTGIGLFVANQFVEGHGGRITIESDTSEKNHGTTMRVFFPLHTPYETVPE